LKTIVITSQKGGSGKTTLAAHLAVEAERAGDAPVWLIDTDQQATLSQWHDRREQETPQRAEMPFARLADGLADIGRRGAAYCFIDTAPTISDQTAAIINLADLVLIPVRPSPADLWSVSETIELVKAAGKPFLFVITQAKAQATITAQTIAALSEHGRLSPSLLLVVIFHPRREHPRPQRASAAPPRPPSSCRCSSVCRLTSCAPSSRPRSIET
jgi:chromosome partitioning protein